MERKDVDVSSIVMVGRVGRVKLVETTTTMYGSLCASRPLALATPTTHHPGGGLRSGLIRSFLSGTPSLAAASWCMVDLHCRAAMLRLNIVAC